MKSDQPSVHFPLKRFAPLSLSPLMCLRLRSRPPRRVGQRKATKGNSGDDRHRRRFPPSLALPCPFVPVPTAAAAALVETEKGVAFSQRARPPPSLPLVPHSLTRCFQFQSSAVGFGVRSAECGLRCSLRFSHDRMAEVPPLCQSV